MTRESDDMTFRDLDTEGFTPEEQGLVDIVAEDNEHHTSDKQEIDRWRSLTQELEDLETTDPAVAEAANRYYESTRRMLGRKSLE